MLNCDDIKFNFATKLQNEEFVIDRTGAKTIEMIGASFLADKSTIIGAPNQEYIKAEIEWYMSQSVNINDIYPARRNPPAAWVASANEHGEINSNYGYLIFSHKYNQQYEQCLDELLTKQDATRRASMIYTRPSIQVEFDEHGKNDFICTNAVTYYIRDRRLCCVVQMRSNDVVYGYKNDYAWQKFVLDKLVKDYNDSLQMFPLLGEGQDDYPETIEAGDIVWQVQNLHVYERHFELLEAYTS
jgi:thymidylate synthase